MDMGFKAVTIVLAITFLVVIRGTEIAPDANRTLTIGVLVSDDFIQPAIPLAIETVNREHILPLGYILNYVEGRTNHENSETALNHMFEWKQKNVTAFIGPVDRCAAEAAVAAAWNLPLISYKNNGKNICNNQKTSTLIQTHPSGATIAGNVLAFLHHYSWKHFVLLIEDTPSYHQIENYLKILSQSSSVQIDSVEYISSDSSRESLIETFDSVHSTSKVYVLLTSNLVLIHFARYLWQKKEHSKLDDYIIISIDDLIYDNTKPYQYILLPQEFRYTEPNHKPSTKITEPFKNVFIIVPNASAAYANFSENMKMEMRKSGVPHNIISNTPIPISAAYAFDAVMIYAQTLGDILLTGGQTDQGNITFKHVQSRPFNTIQGENSWIDSTGEITHNFVILGFVKDANSNSILHPVGKFNYSPSKIEVIMKNEVVHWRNKIFHNDYPPHLFIECHNYQTSVIIISVICTGFLVILIFSVLFSWSKRNDNIKYKQMET